MTSLLDIARFNRGHNKFPSVLMLFLLELKSRSGTAARLASSVLPVPSMRTVDKYNNSGAAVAGFCELFETQTFLQREVRA